MQERTFNWDQLPALVGPQTLLKTPGWPYGRWATYGLFAQPDLPVVRYGRKLVVSRDALRRWFENGGRLE